ncbi:hypothetical protein [Actinomadura alba]|uniref:Uncharacterized protein n=1 Tax=Actinomadura alba TaxID=406431 RepID=A0ABR7LHN5_9ACTN|nr:hypothetical protein [Actinomadura alba]MBC6464005.1 hypothetical protein [Actinomadura alba]
MALTEVLIDQATRDNLGEQLAEVAGSLWAHHCQTCGKPLGDVPPALLVNDIGRFAFAALHHPTCKQARWNNRDVIWFNWHAFSTWTAFTSVMPFRYGDKIEQWPMFLLNPSLEAIALKRDDERRTWHPRFDTRFFTAGMAPPGGRFSRHIPLPGVKAVLSHDSITVRVQADFVDEYQIEAHLDVLERADDLQGVYFVVTHALNPARFTVEEFLAMMKAGRMLIGWASIG